MRILVTGFEPFGGHVVNPSMEVVNALRPTALVIKRLLPVVYVEAGRIVRELIEVERPDAVLSLGLCARSSSIQLERVAVNLNDDAHGDNAGDRGDGRLIVSDGPVGYFSTLPLAAMHAALCEKAIAVTWSNSAGTYVCNHVFYTARHAVEQSRRDCPCGFVHLPPVDQGGLSLAALVDAVETSLDVIVRCASAK